MMVEMVPADPLCIFSDDVIDLLPDTYNAKAPMQQSTIARGATALATAQRVTAITKPLSFRQKKNNDELMIKAGADVEHTFKGPEIEDFLKTYCRTTHCGRSSSKRARSGSRRCAGASPTVSRPSSTAPSPTSTSARR